MRSRSLIVTAALLCLFISPGRADLEYRPGTTCLIRVTDGPVGDHYTRWVRGQLSGAEACVTAGAEIDRQDSRGGFPTRNVCVCVGASHGRTNTPGEGYALCKVMNAAADPLLGPPDGNLRIWCDACDNSSGHRIRVTTSEEDDNKPTDPPYVSVWRERPGECGMFDVQQTNSSKPGWSINFTMRIVQQTSTTIRFLRGSNCQYNGTIAGTSMRGEYDCPASPPGHWKASFTYW